jgi:hypothetical protein
MGWAVAAVAKPRALRATMAATMTKPIAER